MVISFLKKLALPIILFLAGFFVSSYTDYGWAFPVGTALALGTAAWIVFRKPKEDSVVR